MAEECDDQLRAHGIIEVHEAAAAVARGNATSAALTGRPCGQTLDQDIVCHSVEASR